MDWKIALRSFRNLCAFIGAIGLFSYFVNWAADLKHWWVTLVSLVTCIILWFGFYVIEQLGGVMKVVSRLSFSRTHPAEPITSAVEVPVLPAVPPTASSAAEPDEVMAPHPLPWLNPRQQSTR